TVCVFFFFQAEDGIRDWSVTGVQTCALPILFHSARELARGTVRERPEARRIEKLLDLDRPLPAGQAEQLGHEVHVVVDGQLEVRSEERRVGKEGRARRWRSP